MGNCLCRTRQLTEESEPHWPLPFKTIGCSHWMRNEGDWTCPDLGSCSCPHNALPLSSCVFYSPHIQDLIEDKKTELESTQTHWTQVNDKNGVEMVRVGEENCKYFDEVLVNDARWGEFFSKFEGLIVKEKIGEGGQAEIFVAAMKDGDYKNHDLVAKVFKMSIPLRNLKQQWPLEDLCAVSVKEPHTWSPFKMVYGGAFIREGFHKNKFAFVMARRMCDLRALIDEHMVRLMCTSSHGSPFRNFKLLCSLLQSVATDMVLLHDHGVVHRDIKASNVLLAKDGDGEYLMDFECALGTMGTRFWRAAEILEQVRRSVPSQEVVFTKESDIYCFGMLCYEVITGRIPFEEHPQNDFSIVLEGGRPELPNNLDSTLTRLILDCWEGNPQHRPTGREIIRTLQLLVEKDGPLTYRFIK